MKLNEILKNSLMLAPSLLASYAFACSSCGSSATSPLVLSQNENLKMYFGLSVNSNYKNYSGTKAIPNFYLLSRKTLTLAMGYRTSENSFVTITGSALQNEGAKNAQDASQGLKQLYLFGDPIFSGRYSLMNMKENDHYRPQIQLAASYKPGVAKNMVDRDGGSVETVGNGFHQAIGGLDVWYGMSPFQFGATQFVTYSFDRNPNNSYDVTYNQLKRTRDLQYTTVLTVGKVFKEQRLSFQAGAILDYIGEENIYLQNKTTSEKSTKTLKPPQSNSLFAILKVKPSDTETIRVSYTLGGAYDGSLGYFSNSNQTTSDTVTIAYEKSFY